MPEQREYVKRKMTIGTIVSIGMATLTLLGVLAGLVGSWYVNQYRLEQIEAVNKIQWERITTHKHN